MDPSTTQQPPERPGWHFRSVWHYIGVGVLIIVVGGLVLRGTGVLFSGDPEPATTTTSAPTPTDDSTASGQDDEPATTTTGQDDEPATTTSAPTPTDDSTASGQDDEPATTTTGQDDEPATTTSAPTPTDDSTASGQDDEPATTTSVPTPTDGCDRFAVYAQGRWDPMGAAIRTEPARAAPRVRGVQPNVLISVDGWVRSDAPYPTNPDPWNENVWFRLTDRTGWVSFAGVRASPSHEGQTDGPAGGGQPVELIPACELPALANG